MSTPAQKANLARIRDNQRRSRARKREYLQELEQRLRTCELQGIEASAEVQMAARRVAEENRHLRDLLHKQGFSDEYIAHYLQASLTSGPQATSLSPTTTNQFPPGQPSGVAVQSLQHLLAPRRPVGIDPGAPVTLPGQAPGQGSRETSIASASTSNSSIWESQQGIPAGYTHHHSMNVPQSAVVGSAVSQSYSAPIYSAESTPRMDSFPTHQTPQQQHNHPQSMMDNHHPQGYAVRQIPDEMPSAPINYNANPQAAAFNANPRDYGPSGGYC